jgi:hypothetical protein
VDRSNKSQESLFPDGRLDFPHSSSSLECRCRVCSTRAVADPHACSSWISRGSWPSLVRSVSRHILSSRQTQCQGDIGIVNMFRQVQLQSHKSILPFDAAFCLPIPPLRQPPLPSYSTHSSLCNSLFIPLYRRGPDCTSRCLSHSNNAALQHNQAMMGYVVPAYHAVASQHFALKSHSFRGGQNCARNQWRLIPRS